ncbi:MAG TPA: TetR/AcrR family transcriptional regulator [Gemmatimonadaceae bacterium]|nr:TetR/AcrR family transcriptional regulator [Gemmatimonadaceae bacterium]
MMPSAATDRREREKLAIRTKILDAARELFAEQGYEAVTMRQIAERIEYTPTAIYYHFKDKDALIRELCDVDYGALAIEFQKIATVANPIDRMKGMGRAYARFAIEFPHHYRLMFMTPHPPDMSPLEKRGKPDQDAYAFLTWTVGQAVAAGQVRPEYQDVELASQTIWAAMHGLITLQIAKGGDPWVDWRPYEQRVEAMLDLVLHGILNG